MGTFKVNGAIKASGNISASSFIGDLTGNAATASKLATARTISLTGSVTGSGSFDGSGNLSIATTVNHTHSYLPLLGGTITGEVRFGAPGQTNFIPLNFYRGPNNNQFGLCGESGNGGSIYASDNTRTNLISITLTKTIFSTGIQVGGCITPTIGGSSWYIPITNPTSAAMYYDASSSTSSTYWPFLTLKFPNTTYSIGGERAGNVFGIYSYANTRTENGHDGAFYVNGNNHYFYCSTKIYGAVWNDYAEYRDTTDAKPGEVIIENGDGTLHKSHSRLEPGANIITDTFGFSIGETDQTKTPIAVAGRVLAYPYEDRYSYKPGAAVCSAPDGKISQMTREEMINYPDCIIGFVSEIPEYEIWGTGNVEVNGRIWIKIK